MTLTNLQRVLLDRAREDGQPLDPEQRDDAAVLLRAEVLVRGGASGSDALEQARREHVVFCEVCREAKPAFPRADFPGLAWPVCGHQPVHDEQVTFEHFLGESR